MVSDVYSQHEASPPTEGFTAGQNEAILQTAPMALASSIGVSTGLTMAFRTGGPESLAGKLSLALLGGLFLRDAAQRMNPSHTPTAIDAMNNATTNIEVDKNAMAAKIGNTIFEQQLPKSANLKAFEGDLKPTLDARQGRVDSASDMKARSAEDDSLKAKDRKPQAERTVDPAKVERDIANLWRKTQGSIDQAVNNRGRETNAFKSMHDYLKLLKESSIAEGAKQQAFDIALAQVSRIRDWDRPQWFRREPSNWRDESGKRVTEHDFIRNRSGMSTEEMQPWDEWAKQAALSFRTPDGIADDKISALDDYLVRRVSIDSVKNWLRRRPDEQFVNDMFAALAENKLYIGESALRIRSMKDNEGAIRPVEMRDCKLYFEASEEEIPVKEDARGRYVELPDDSDMVVFERRAIGGKRQIVPISQPNDRDPNIQWFGGGQVKRGWQKEQRFLSGPEAFSPEELYGFFPDHFPMRVTNSVEGGKPTEKTGAAIYGYARDHAGRQARQLIAEYGEVMDGLKRNNSQLINDARIVFGLQKAAKSGPGTIEFESPYPTKA